MPSYLPIGIESLLEGGVDPSGIEFEAHFDPKFNGDQIVKTISAFANDLHNLNGDYIILGIRERDRVAQRPVEGMEVHLIDETQRQILEACSLIQPRYLPLIEVSEVDRRQVIVL